EPAEAVVAVAPARGASVEATSERAPASADLPSANPPDLNLDPGTLRPAGIPSGPPASEFLRKALVDAESFRGLKLYAKASQCLRQALAAAPESLELRAALQQVLLEAGDRPAAVEQMLAVARMYIERGSLSAAEAELYQVLELSPELPIALRLLEQVETLARDTLSRPGRSRPRRPPPPEARKGQDEPSGPASQSEHEAFELRTRVSSPPLRAAATVPPQPPPGEVRLPAYDLEEDDLATGATPTGTAPGKTPDAPLPQFTLDSGLLASPELLANATSVRPPPSRRDSVRAALDEADFFSSRGLYQDASMILRDRLEQYPGDAELIEAIAQLEPKLTTESGTRDVGRLSVEETKPDALPTSAAAAAAASEGRKASRPELAAAAPASSSFGKELRVQFSTDGKLDRGAVLDADSDLDIVNSLEQPEERQIDVDEVFAKFKQGVKAQIADSDSATHYDLGVAYKEMGLLSDAAREFEIASIDPKLECTCLAMMGMMYRERGELDRAAEAYVRGLNAKHKTVAQEMSLYYDLGTIYEMKNDADEAIYYFQRIMRRDPSYRDVPKRLQALEPKSRRFSQPARAINDDQEFDRTFDELYERE
ncbi:MAG TPA: tetratricopeptide repeat protein, partial [Polyangiaceae bacterium]|nr:tetratricopeptide repeat protein [Polyangiaceae bacterium]